MKKSIAYAKTEVLTIWRDKKALVLIISFPIFFALLYGLVLGAFSEGKSNNFLAAIPSTLATMTAFTCVNGSAGSVARTRENKLFARLLLTNIKSMYLILGKVFYFLLITCMQTLLLLLTGSIFFGLALEDIGWILFGTLMFAFFCLTLGIVLANLTDSEDGAEHSTVLISFMMLVLGAWFPVENMPDVAQKIAHANPVFYFLKIINTILQNGNVVDVIIPIIVIVVLCMVAFLMAIITFKKGNI